MARRAELFVRALSDEEAARLLNKVRRGKNAVVRHRAMLLFASFQGQSLGQISLMFQASATHVAALIHAFNEQGFPALDPRWGGGRPRRIDLDERTEIVKVALARPADRGEPFTRWSLTKLRAHLLRSRIVPGHQPQPAVADPPRGRCPLHPPQDLEVVARSRVRDQEEPDPGPVCPSTGRCPGAVSR